MTGKIETVKTLLQKPYLKKFTAAYGAASRDALDGVLNSVQMLEGYPKLFPLLKLMYTRKSRRSPSNMPIRMTGTGEDVALGDIINMVDIPAHIDDDGVVSAVAELRNKMRIRDDFTSVIDYVNYDADGKMIMLDLLPDNTESLVMSEQSIINGVEWLKKNTKIVNSPADCVMIGIETLQMQGWGGDHWKALASIGLPVVGGIVTSESVNDGSLYRRNVIRNQKTPQRYSTVDTIPFMSGESMDNQLRCGGLFVYHNHWTTHATSDNMVFFVAPRALYDIGNSDNTSEIEDLLDSIENVPSMSRISNITDSCVEEVSASMERMYKEQTQATLDAINKEINALMQQVTALKAVESQVRLTSSHLAHEMSISLSKEAVSVLQEVTGDDSTREAIEVKEALARLTSYMCDEHSDDDIDDVIRLSRILKGDTQ